MKRNIWALIVVCALVISSCGTKPAEAPPAAPSQSAESPKATEAPRSTDAPKPTDTVKLTEVPRPTKTQPMLYVTSVTGTVEVRRAENEAFAPAKVGQKIGEGAMIRTSADGIAVLYRDKISMVVLDKSSEMRVKKLAFKSSKPITILSLSNGAAAVEHKGKMEEGAVFALETPNKDKSGVVGSTLRVSYDPETKTMTAVCVTGECNLVKGDQKLNLTEGQAVDVQGLAPIPGMPEEMTTEQANQFLGMAHQMCGCELTIGEIRDQGLEELVPPLDEVPTPEEDLEQSANENGDTVDENGNTTNENGDTVDPEGNIIPDSENIEQPPTDEQQPPADGEQPPAGGG
jgi:hypothetical protein